jgi:hydroxypyruvate isomerase
MTVATFAANLTFLWSELPFLERFAAAREAGFAQVEYMFPYEYPAEEIRARLDPGRVEEFRSGVERAIVYAEALDVPQLNCLAGLQLDGVDRTVQWTTLVENVRHAARRLGANGRRLLVEPVNTFDVPRFLLPKTDDVLRLLDEVADPDVRLQFDAYHVQRMEGDPATKLQALFDRVGHVQVADNPGRHQPGTGEIDFEALFRLLDDAGYGGAVGLEYVPDPDTEGSLTWLEQYGFALTGRS